MNDLDCFCNRCRRRQRRRRRRCRPEPRSVQTFAGQQAENKDKDEQSRASLISLSQLIKKLHFIGFDAKEKDPEKP